MSVRRTWDKNEYAQKAVERAWREQYDQDGDGSSAGTGAGSGRKVSDKDEFKAAGADSAGPMGSSRAYIEARKVEVTGGDEVGKVKVVTAAQMEVGAGAGFYCEVCKCLLKDNMAYISHVNGKNHQRALGFSMRVERKGVSSVKDKLAGLKRKLKGEDTDCPPARAPVPAPEPEPAEEKESGEGSDDDTFPSKKKKKQEVEEEDDVGAEEVDPEMAAMMGFGGFGGGKKR